MYGLIIEAIVHHITQTYGEQTWLEVRRLANIHQVSFSTHERYSENLVPNIAIATSQITGVPTKELVDSFGVVFVPFVGQYGYDRILKVLGRHMTDFLNGLDNLHEYLRFSYPKIKPPSFIVEEENKNGLTLHYRSKRKGYVNYLKGQIRQVGKQFYNTDVKIEVVSEEETDNLTHVILKLFFDNTAYIERLYKTTDAAERLPLRSDVFFQLFPFHMVFGKDLLIQSAGEALKAVMPKIIGQALDDKFSIVLPLIQLTWQTIIDHSNNAFELLSNSVVKRRSSKGSVKRGIKVKEGKVTEQQKEEGSPDKGFPLHLKGQMMYMKSWDAIIFLGTPIMESLDVMFKTGLYINDLSMHDSSRDLILAGTQQSAELKLALDQEQKKSKILEESMDKLDAEMKRTDTLLYQMIPKQVADRLRRGEPAITTCEVFDHVTILFSDVVGFTHICSQITPMEVVSMLNAMYTEFDQLTEKHKVYKVETIGDAYMVVSGAPDRTKYHALHISDMALDMLDAVGKLRDPSNESSMKLRVGVHTGTAVAGVVGLKMPRYCLFGDTVNTASRMETNGEAMKIHVSETTREELLDFPYLVEERSTISVKGKGLMKTYWLLGKEPGEEIKVHKRMLSSVVVDDLSQVKGNDYPEDQSPASVRRYTLDGNILHAKRSLYAPVSFDDVKKVQSLVPSTGGPGFGPKLSVGSYVEKRRDSEDRRGSNPLVRELRFYSVGTADMAGLKDTFVRRENLLEDAPEETEQENTNTSPALPFTSRETLPLKPQYPPDKVKTISKNSKHHKKHAKSKICDIL